MRASALVLCTLALSSCATFKNTPQQDYIWELGRLCDARVAFWKMEKVEADGRYWIRSASGVPPGRDDYLACMSELMAQTPYREWLRKQGDDAL